MLTKFWLNRTLVRPRRAWGKNIIMDHSTIGLEDPGWIYVSQDTYI
jgi:hypothetical protein